MSDREHQPLPAVRLDDGDLPAVEALFNAVFPWKPVPAGFARWRYGSREIGGLCVGVRDPATGRVVAAHGVQLLPATGGVLVGLSVDVMVASDHQRRGLGALMEEQVRIEAERAGCASLICFPNPKLASLRAKIPEWQTVLDARAYSVPAGRFAAASADRAWKATADLPEGIDTLWRAMRKRTPDVVGIDRSRDYLAWRFRKNPLHRYDWIVPVDRDAPAAAAATKVWVDPVTNERVGDVVELVALDPSGAMETLLAACRHLRSQSVSRMTLWAPRTVSESALAGCGFEPDPALARSLQVRSLAQRPRIDFSKWFLTQSDTDLY